MIPRWPREKLVSPSQFNGLRQFKPVHENISLFQKRESGADIGIGFAADNFQALCG